MNKKIIKASLGVLLVVLIFLWVLPVIVKSVVESNSNSWLGRSLSIDNVDINLFTSSVKVFGLKLYEQDDSTPFVQFEQLVVDLEIYRLLKQEVVLEQFYLQGLDVNVVMFDSTYNFDDIVAHFESEPTDSLPPAEETVKDPMAVILSNIELKDAFIQLNDDVAKEELEFKNISFFIPYIALGKSNNGEAGLRFDFENGGYFKSEMDINPKVGDFNASVGIHGLGMSGYEDFLAKYVELGRLDGLIDLKLNVAGNIHQIESTTASGMLQVKDFVLEDVGPAPLLGFESFKVTIDEVDVANKRILIDSVLLSAPNIHFEMFDSTNNLVRFIDRAIPADTTASQVADTTMTSGDSTNFYYSLNTFRIEQGKVKYTDSRTGEPFIYNLSSMSLSADSITSESEWVTSQASMLLNERGKLVASLGIEPSNPMNLILDYTITNFMLADLNIYSKFYTGMPILYGDMYYKAHTEIEEGQLVSENQLIIRNVELGPKEKGTSDLPIRFALFLLKDKDGVINLDVPVRGDLDDPKVSINKIVWGTLKNLVLKAVAAPGKLLAGLVGGKSKEISEIKYDFLDSAFSEGKQKQVDLLLELEQKKPELEIELVYYNDVELEKEEAAVNLLGQEFEKKTGQNYKKETKEFELYVRQKTGVDTIDVAVASRLLTDSIEVKSLADQYQTRRFESLSKYLLATSDSSSIKIHRAKKEDPKNIGSQPIFEVKYGMKGE